MIHSGWWKHQRASPVLWKLVLAIHCLSGCGLEITALGHKVRLMLGRKSWNERLIHWCVNGGMVFNLNLRGVNCTLVNRAAEK